MRISPLFELRDLWIGFFWDSKKRWLYVLPIPCCGFILKFETRESLKRSKAHKQLMLTLSELNKSYRACSQLDEMVSISDQIKIDEAAELVCRIAHKLQTKEV